MNRHLILQSLLAGVYILIAFALTRAISNEVAVASLGASAYIAFSIPHKEPSRPRNMIGGYLVGVICGLACYGLSLLTVSLTLPLPNYVIVSALAVLLVMLVMNVTNCKHPPAAALSVAVVIDTNPIVLGLAGLVCVTVLCVIKEALKKYLRDL